MNYIAYKIINRLIEKTKTQNLVRKLLKRVVSSRLSEEKLSRESVNLNNFNDEDLRLLFSITPPSLKSCICHNEINFEYDLQIMVPVYNVEDYIEKCIDSIVNQKTKYKVLILIINDGSQDGSRIKLKKYEGMKNVKIIDQKNKGYSGARNTGLNHIYSKYISFVDSDDKIVPESLDLLLDAAYYNDADIVEGGFKILKNGKFSSRGHHNSIKTTKWVETFYGVPWGKVIKSSLFRDFHFPEGYWFEDTIMAMILYPKCKTFITIPNDVYIYRINPQGISSKSRGNVKSLDSLYVTIQLLEDEKELGIKVDQQLYDHFLHQVLNNQHRIYSLNSGEINKKVFLVSCRLYRQYFKAFSTDNPKLSGIENALKTVDYGNYLLESIL